MKLLLITLLLGICLSTNARAYTPTYLRTRISDDGTMLLIQIDAYKNGRMIHFKQTTDVSGLNRLQTELVMYRAFNSQGIFLPVHKMPTLCTMAFGLVALIGMLLIAVYRIRQTSQMTQVQTVTNY
ncbi:hypothetical protein [Spirosoma fluminis]